MPKKSIGTKQIHQAYVLGCRVISQDIQSTDAIDILASNYDMSSESAQYYINNLVHMYRGEIYKLTINAEATEYFLDSILADFGKSVARRTLFSLESHIAHRQAVHGDRQIRNSKIASRFRQKISVETIDVREFERDFEKRNHASSKLTLPDRKKRLRLANAKPKEVYVVSRTFIRNPDVIAEALERANGICDECQRQAPFIRASNGTPYLEVHHKTPLAEDGDDTIENAVALCPNCHREAHFGVDKLRFRQ